MRLKYNKVLPRSKGYVPGVKRSSPHFGPDTAFCKKVTYLRPVAGGHACWACGCYHEGPKI